MRFFSSAISAIPTLPTQNRHFRNYLLTRHIADIARPTRITRSGRQAPRPRAMIKLRPQNGTEPRARQVQIVVLPPIPPSSPPKLSCPPSWNFMPRPEVMRADQPCSNGVDGKARARRIVAGEVVVAIESGIRRKADGRLSIRRDSPLWHLHSLGRWRSYVRSARCQDCPCSAFMLPHGVNARGRLEHQRLPAISAGQSAGGQPAAARECSRRRPGRAIEVDAGARHREVEAHLPSQSPTEIAADRPAVAFEPAVERIREL